MTTLNYADKVYLGSSLASAVYIGANKVWPAFKPNDLTGCTIWLDASQLNLANGAAVSSWTNLGSGPQPTILGTPAPTFQTNVLNTTLPVVRITGGQGQWRFASTGVDKDYTIIYVGRKWSLRAGRVIAANTSNASAGNILWGFHGTEYESAHVESWMVTPGPSGGVTANTIWKLYSGDTTSAAAARLFSDGVYLGATAGIPAKGLAGTLCIGGYEDGARAQEPDSEIAELILYNRKLTDAERRQVEQYLRIKWGLLRAFQPTDISGCVIWLDASQNLTNAASWWTNLGSGPQPYMVGSPPPTLQPAALNGRQVVRFTGAQGRLRFTGTGIDKDYTVSFVARRWSTRAGRVLAAHIGGPGAPNILFGFWSTRFDCAYVEGWLAPDDIVTDTLAWRQYTVDTTSTAVARLFKNGAVLRSGAVTPAKGVGGTLNLCGHDDAATEDADCEFAEVTMYNRKLSDPERAQVEQYLRLKWAVA
jgi:hypothetical protein